MSVSTFLLALFVFLVSTSEAYLGWFTTDPKFIGIVGVAFVIGLIIENWFAEGHPSLRLWRRKAQHQD